MQSPIIILRELKLDLSTLEASASIENVTADLGLFVIKAEPSFK